MKRASTSRKGSANGRGGNTSSKSANRSSAASRNNGASNGRGSAAKKSGTSRGGKQRPDTEEGLNKLMEALLRDTYWAEKQLTKALPKLAKAAESQELKDAFEQHLEETEQQIERLEQVFERLGMKATAKKCEAMEGLIAEGREVIEEFEAGPLRDAALIIAAQKVEHYEIAAYGSMRTLASIVGQDEAAQLLEETLDEESNTDETLTQIAMRINREAEDEAGGNTSRTSGSAEEDEGDYDDEEMEDDEEENTEDEVDEEAGTARTRR